MTLLLFLGQLIELVSNSILGHNCLIHILWLQEALLKTDSPVTNALFQDVMADEPSAYFSW